MKKIILLFLLTINIAYSQTYDSKQTSRELLNDILNDEFKDTDKVFFDAKTLKNSMEVNNVFFVDVPYSKMAQSYIVLEKGSKDFIYNVVSFMYSAKIIYPLLDNVDIMSIYFNIYFKSNDDKEIKYLYYVNTEDLVKITDETTKEDFLKIVYKK